MIKQLISMMLIGLLMIPGAMAEDEYAPGFISPDSPLWGLDLQLEKIQERFAWNNEHRMTIQLRHMDERIGEMQTGEQFEKVTQHYLDGMSRIENNTARYEATQRAVTCLQEHKVELDTMMPDLDPGQVGYTQQHEYINQMRNRAQLGDTTLQGNVNRILDDESVWFDAKVTQYSISSTPTPISNYGDFDKYAKHLEDGSTLVNIVSSDGEIVQSYTITKERDQNFVGGIHYIITIQTGTTPDYVKEYTITIEELQDYEALI